MTYLNFDSEQQKLYDDIKSKACKDLKRELTDEQFIIHILNREIELKTEQDRIHLRNRWNGMKIRCNNEKNPNYHRYGERGIKLCPEWENDFEAFYEWSVNNGWDEKLSIDRIDNDKGYSPDNCRWVDSKTQQNNKSNNKFYTYNGKTQTVSQWAKEYGISVSMLSSRLKAGYDMESSLTRPSGKISEIDELYDFKL